MSGHNLVIVGMMKPIGISGMSNLRAALATCSQLSTARHLPQCWHAASLCQCGLIVKSPNAAYFILSKERGQTGTIH